MFLHIGLISKKSKSAHAALRAYWGANSHTKCSITFVNIAVAISALAGGGGQKRFRTETTIFQPSPNPGGVFVVFGRFLDV